MEKIIELVWSGLAVIGSLILAEKLTDKLQGQKLVGALLIFAGFVIQALWNSYNILGLSGAIGVLVIIVLGLLLVLRNRIKR